MSWPAAEFGRPAGSERTELTGKLMCGGRSLISGSFISLVEQHSRMLDLTTLFYMAASDETKTNSPTNCGDEQTMLSLNVFIKNFLRTLRVLHFLEAPSLMVSH